MGITNDNKGGMNRKTCLNNTGFKIRVFILLLPKEARYVF